MKRIQIFLLSVLLLFVTVRLAPAFTVTNEVWLLDDNSSWSASQVGTMTAYLAVGFDCVFPQYTNGIFDLGHSGASLENQVETHREQEALAVMCGASSNHVAFYDWVRINDNGDYASNDVINWGTNWWAGPPLFWNGAIFTNEGISVTGLKSATGTILNSSSSTGDGGAVARQRGSSALNALEGIADDVDAWDDTKTNLAPGVSITDITGSILFYVGGHPTPAHSAAIFTTTWKQKGLPTAIGAICFDFNGARVGSSNNIAASSVVKSGNTLTATIRANNMPPRFDRHSPTTPSGVISNNVAVPDMYVYFPSFTNSFTWIWQATNLPPGNYELTLDGAHWAYATDSELASGLNMATNSADVAFNLQGDAMLAAYRNKIGVDPVTQNPAHNAGSAGVGGHRDLINYLSDSQFEFVNNGLRGSALVNALAADVKDMRALDVPIHDAAQQTNHVLAITLISSTPTTNHLNTVNVQNLVIDLLSL